MATDHTLPFQAVPHDSLRQGLPALKEVSAVGRHPVEVIQEASRASGSASGPALRDLYGSAFVARQHIEQQILGKFQRLPGVPSSQLGLEALTGSLDDFSFDSYLGFPGESDLAQPDMHSQLEARHGIQAGAMQRGLP
jgi:proteasome maturation protein